MQSAAPMLCHGGAASWRRRNRVSIHSRGSGALRWGEKDDQETADQYRQTLIIFDPL